MHRRLLSIVLMCVLGLARVAHAQLYDFALVPDHPLTVDDFVLISSVEPMTDDDGVLYYEIEAVLLEPDVEDPITICMTSFLAPDPGDLLEIEDDTVPVPGIGDPDPVVGYGANRVSLVDISPNVKLKQNRKLRVAFFGSAVIDVAMLDPLTMRLGDPTLGGAYALPIKAVYEDLDGDGFLDAKLTFDVGELLARGSIDADTQILEFGFGFRGLSLSMFDEVEIRD